MRRTADAMDSDIYDSAPLQLGQGIFLTGVDWRGYPDGDGLQGAVRQAIAEGQCLGMTSHGSFRCEPVVTGDGQSACRPGDDRILGWRATLHCTLWEFTPRNAALSMGFPLVQRQDGTAVLSPFSGHAEEVPLICWVGEMFGSQVMIALRNASCSGTGWTFGAHGEMTMDAAVTALGQDSDRFAVIFLSGARKEPDGM